MATTTSADSPSARGSAEGLLLLDKPAGITSHDAVDAVRRAYGERSIGHLGTLDPFATGLLIVLVGRSTRLATFIVTEPKVYRARIAFGTETMTDDPTGEATRSASPPSEAAVRKGIEELTGELSQIPPAYSAKQIDGKRAYVAAREGKPLDLAPSQVTVHKWHVLEWSAAGVVAEITCSTGTYIRALARDLGRLTGSAAHLAALRRTRSGEFDVASAITLDRLATDRPHLRQLRITADA